MKNLTIIILMVLFTVAAVPVYAIDAPNFPSCVNPSGDLIVEYPDGTHGVPGDSHTYTGKDSVYSVNDTQVLQCLCTDNGDGIQTNWWKTSSLTQDQIDTLTKQGWKFVPNGQNWGLDKSNYLTKNSNYSCSNDEGKVISTSTINTNGIGGAVLGLAATGNNKELIGLASLGVTMLLLSLFLKRSFKK